MVRVKIKPESPFHIGKKGVGQEGTERWVRSDTLAGGIFNAWVVVHGEEDLKNLLSTFNESFPFRISSAFPWFKEKTHEVFFYPRPLLPLGEMVEEEVLRDGKVKVKDIKKSKLVPEYILRMMLDGRKLGRDEIQQIRDGNTILGEHVKEETLPRVAMGPLSVKTNYYRLGALFFSDDSGLYFLAEFSSDEVKEKFMAALRYLGETGIGGKRTSGMGKFTIEDVEEVEFPADGDRFLSLSLVSPADEEEAKSGSGEFVERSGWVNFGRPKRQLNVVMFEEGSVFEKKVKGRLVDVTPSGCEKRIYRYGIAFVLGMKGG